MARPLGILLCALALAALLVAGCQVGMPATKVTPPAPVASEATSDPRPVQTLGAPGPAEAAGRYLRAVASGDATGYASLTGKRITLAGIAVLRASLYGTSAPVIVDSIWRMEPGSWRGYDLVYQPVVRLKDGHLVGVVVASHRARGRTWAVVGSHGRLVTEADVAGVKAEEASRVVVPAD